MSIHFSNKQRRQALPYQVQPAIPARLQNAAYAAEKWAKDFKDKKTLLDLGEYMSRMGVEASSLIDAIEYLSRYRLKEIAEDKELFRYGPGGLLNRAKYDNHVYSHLTSMEDYLGYVEKILREFEETLYDYIDFDGFNFRRPLNVSSEQLKDLNTYYDDYQTNVVPALDIAVKVEDITKTLREYTEYKKRDIELRMEERKHESPYASEKFRPEGLESLEIMWHVTSAYSKVLQEGLKSKRQLVEESDERPVGLGGGQDKEVSFTASLEFAEGIKDDLLGMMKIAREEHTLRDLINIAMDWGLSDKGVEEAIRTYEAVKPSDPLPNLDEIITFNQSRWFYDYLRSEASGEGLVYYAAFWGPDLETFAKIDPNEVDIIEAVVDTTSEKTTYHKAEEEWRIPPKNILSIGPVGSQEQILEKMKLKKAAVIHKGSVYQQEFEVN